VEKNPMEVRRSIGYLPENNPLYKDLYVKEYLTFVARLHDVKNIRRRVDEMVQMTGLEREQKKVIGALSKGYRQRVGLAQAMLHDPQVLILDEPTSGLDPNQLAEIRNLIKQLGKQKTVIFSTHIMQEVQALCDRVVIINKGVIVANDTIETLQSRVKGESVVTVEFAGSIDKTLLTGIPKVQQVKDLGKNRWQLLAPAEVDIRPDIHKFVIKHNLTLLEMHKEVSSVEDVFQQLTK
jgi:ABC-2 type transport system ATP-binding protein